MHIKISIHPDAKPILDSLESSLSLYKQQIIDRFSGKIYQLPIGIPCTSFEFDEHQDLCRKYEIETAIANDKTIRFIQSEILDVYQRFSVYSIIVE